MGDLITNLGIDWKLLLAQVVNFLILLFVLKKFLYKPVLTFLDKRKTLIQKGIQNAERIDEKLAQIQLKEDAVLTKARGTAQEIIATSKKTGVDESAQIVQQAEKRVEAMLQDAKQKIDSERDTALQEARHELGKLVLLATHKILGEDAVKKLDATIIEQAIKKI
ncbi:MAG: ATP synthase F0 subunit B [Parcubacteria group bacterium RIFCSPHIGHO2_01_FULL_47_10b]|nr:MAG: ATP synthase F0 subunit B [Parcubacteria group bacterium RIFCSPHIGHO2_01_FULL_47_10b]